MKILEPSPSGAVTIREDMLRIPEFGALYEEDSKKDKSRFYNYLLYIYHVYSKESVYANLLGDDRKAIVCQDLFGDPLLAGRIESNPKVKDFIDKYICLSLSPKERYLMGVIDKIDQYLQFWKDTKIDKDNHKLIADTLTNAEDLLKLQDRLERQVFQEKSERAVGGGKATLFEDG